MWSEGGGSGGVGMNHHRGGFLSAGLTSSVMTMSSMVPVLPQLHHPHLLVRETHSLPLPPKSSPPIVPDIKVHPVTRVMSSPGPTPRRGVSGLRQCDSLENICDTTHLDGQHLQNGLSAQAAAANAISLPHINQISDYEEDEANTTRETFPSHLQLEHSKSEPHGPRPEKNKKTKLRRRRAYYRTQRDGRSKSLTHIDSLGGEGGMLLHGDSMEGTPPQDTLGVPGDLTSLRRKKLSVAGKISSGDYVVVVLDYLQEPVEEFIPATRGTSLRSALERLGVELPSVQVVVEGTRTPLNLNTDINLLGGKTLRVRGRDESRSPSRSRSAGSGNAGRKTSHVRTGQGRFLWGASSEDYVGLDSQDKNGSQDGSLKVKPNKSNNRWSIFPNNSKDTKMDSLVQQLDLYSKQGIPHCDLSEIEVHCEGSWRDIVESSELMDDRQDQQQSAIWELVETEATYIHMLKVMTDLFLSCLCNLQDESILNEIEIDHLFGNIQEIYAANLSFWQDHIIRMVEHSRNTRQPLDPTILTEAFYKFDEMFHPYTQYCLDQSNCQLYCKEKDYDNEHFKMYLAWCETQKECNRLRLVDILVQPMQRLTKYSLLLKAIAKKTDIDQHKITLHEMIHHVESFVSNVNSALRHRHEQERLRDIAKRIEAYDVVDSREDELERVVRSYSDLNLTQPMPGCPEHLPRHLLHHGDLKLRDAHTSKMEVHVFLFTDLLLITKVTQRKAEKVKIVRPPYHVDRLIVVDVKDITALGLVSINEWNVAVAAFTLQCPDIRTHRVWLDQIRRAQEQYNEAKQSRDVLVFDDISYASNIAPRSPRAGSSRASRVSSLGHSHSGSMDLNEASSVSSVGGVGSMHHPSMDLSEVRASSASSEDSGSHNPDIQRTSSLESGGGNSSPRTDRRSTTSKTSNTLSVNPPHSAGQSLPNLSENCLRVPSTSSNSPKQLLTNNRGISYPPPSPRTLRRSAPIPQSRNPPLIKSRNLVYNSAAPQTQETGTSQDESPEDPTRGGPRPRVRTERLDNRRYHTAGVIDDIKKQDSKNTAIHKRLSLNYGQDSQSSPRELGADANRLSRNKHRSCDSMQSSSGVSSTSSLHRSYGSELEALEHIDDNELEGECSTVIDLPVSGECTQLKLSPHISTTYICHDSDITVTGCSQYITQPQEHLEESGVDGNTSGMVKIDVAESAEDPSGISSIQIKVTERNSSSTSSDPASSDSSSTDGDSGTNTTQIRELLLNDASIEASDV
ncbi:unnamed protein product [Meganyctiphanes norvegica]|uniref:DH domain-containing protein n=1 Tax=Meganyctiphanes norvegica TaxID=48144 RepID=A0AAV2PNS6_MEGNR